ncbi:hypothetical protein OSB04_un001073 [Centaurea solstitialis]|uniref:Uncharacterized protein n=1 Tax=Centaurea solstitialis TaxID=347529 RepID=A0AA38SBF1_9ASTR|nr:hypothetical protein OSB04_un001073 [Centaurea solstitialis]
MVVVAVVVDMVAVLVVGLVIVVVVAGEGSRRRRVSSEKGVAGEGSRRRRESPEKGVAGEGSRRRRESPEKGVAGEGSRRRNYLIHISISRLSELLYLTNLEELDLSDNYFNDTPSIQECKRLSSLKKLKSIALRSSVFNKSVISCLSALSSLKTLDLSSNHLGELSHLSHDLEVLLLNGNDFNGTLPMEGIFIILFPPSGGLDLSHNNFVGSIPSTIQELSSLRAVSFASNRLNGSLPNHGLCDLKNLIELDLSHNMFDGSLPQCFNQLSSLKLLDISSNQFSGILKPSLITNLTSLEYVDFSNNKFRGSFLLSSFSNLTKLEVVIFVYENDDFKVETEEPSGWIPMFQLKLLMLSGCNINRPKGSVVPKFLLHQRMLQVIDLSDNSLVGPFPNWLIENNTMLSVLILRKNSFSGSIRMSPHMNSNMRWLDVSENHINGIIPDEIHKFLPYIIYLNLSNNILDGVIPSSIGHLSWLSILDLSDNKLSGEVPKGLLSNLSVLSILRLSENRLHGQVLSGNLSLGSIQRLHLDKNCFTGKIGNATTNLGIQILDISYNSFIGKIPHWISNSYYLSEVVMSNNNLEGPFPCGTTPFSFLDISQNSFSGPIPSCLNFRHLEHLHLGSNRFTGSISNVFRNLTRALTLDIGNNSFSGPLPKFLGNLSDLRILILRKNNFSGSIPMELCQLRNLSLIDLSSNSLSGLIPSCLQNITSPIYPAFVQDYRELSDTSSYYKYLSVLQSWYSTFYYNMMVIGTQDEVQFTTKTLSLAYKGGILDYMVGLDLSSNKLTREIPKELGLLIEIRSMNLSHNQLGGPIPTTFSNLEMIESLDLSSNNLTGEVSSQLIQLHYLSDFNVSNNNLSGRLPDMKAQFSTFTMESYEGNPLLCGPPLKKKCTDTSQVNDPSTKEDNDKWHDIDMVSFYGSSSATCVVFLLGFVAVLYINPYWRRRWLDMVEECMYTCYYFVEDSLRKISRLFHK